MKIIIIGAGKVGFSLAQRLSEEKHDIVLIERDRERREIVDNYLDVMTIVGHGASPRVLEAAGVKNSDLVIAVTDIDEVNMIACMTAKHFGARKTIARVRDPEYAEYSKSFFKQLAGIDLIINPELVTAIEISKVLKTPAALDVEDYAEGKVQLVELRVDPGSPVIGRTLKEAVLPPAVLIAAILRDDKIIIPRGHDTIKKDDIVFIVGQTESMEEAEIIIGTVRPPVQKVMILGGGRIGLYLAKILESYNMDVKLIENNREQCEYLATQLKSTLVLHGDGTDLDLLKEEGAGDVDAFIALTSDDKTNFLIAQLAKQLGAQKTVVQVKRSDYIPIMEHVGIDVAISPRIITAGVILRLVRRGEIVSISLLEGDKAEVIEMELTTPGPFLDVPLQKANFPAGTLVGAIVREGKVIIPNGRDVFKLGDKIVVFSLPQQVSKIESFFAQKAKRRKKR
ncbi:Trk system potassium transporter TrkA [Zhaonella formicivorans]|uniref:Trk system potassium transporter TrkA n=1 Tax=Zhaonella formicivorans TaxID=2528593 RepID=UPI0010E73EB9|nr:Trk system potassium transporter TrkA [Zhaonella formicivorans]